jgi:hypothetical protein
MRLRNASEFHFRDSRLGWASPCVGPELQALFMCRSCMGLTPPTAQQAAAGDAGPGMFSADESLARRPRTPDPCVVRRRRQQVINQGNEHG